MIPSETIRHVLSAALRNGGDLAELYLENTEVLNLYLDDSRLERATQGNDIGGGVRVFYGNTAAYAYSDDLSESALIEAAEAAAAAAKGSNEPRITINLARSQSALDFPVKKAFDQMSTGDKAGILRQMDQAARAYSPHIKQVQANYRQTSRRVWIYNSDGLWAEDDREIIEFAGMVTAQKGDVRQTMTAGIGGQMGLDLSVPKGPVAGR